MARKITLFERSTVFERLLLSFRTKTSKDSPTRRILIFRRQTVTRMMDLTRRFLDSKDGTLTSKDCSKDSYLSNLLNRKMICRARKISFEHTLTHWHKVDWKVTGWCGWWTTFRQKGCSAQTFHQLSPTLKILPKREASYPHLATGIWPEYLPENSKPFKTKF